MKHAREWLQIIGAYVGILMLLAFAGCASAGSGAKWWSPATWGSASPARATQKAESDVNEKREATLKAAQRATHESLFALMLSAASRTTDVAREAAQTAAGLLDQALGALPVDELSRLKLRVDGLTSENAAIRKAAEVERADARKGAAALAHELDDARARLKTAQSDLLAAFARENALANELRNDRLKSMLWKIGLGSGILIFAGLYVYVRFVAGGIPGALGKMLAFTQSKNPSLASAMRAELDPYLNRTEQVRIKKHVVKEAARMETV